MSAFPERPKVVMPELREVAAEARKVIGETAVVAADAILDTHSLQRRAKFQIGRHNMFGTNYVHERARYDHPADRRKLEAFPGQQLSLLSVLQDELRPNNTDVYTGLIIEDAARYVVAHVVTPTDNPSLVEYGHYFGIASNGEVAIPGTITLHTPRFSAPSEHVITREPMGHDDVMGHLIGGFEDSLAATHSLATAVDGVPTDRILELYSRLTSMEGDLVVPRQAYTATWEAAALPDLTRPPQG